MAKGLRKHQERLIALNALGKNLARRSRSTCELCERSGVSLSIYEVAPIPDEPDIAHCLMVCEKCFGLLSHPKQKDDNHWRCLTKTIWSPLPAAQVMAFRQLKKLAVNTHWAAEQLEQAYIDEAIAAWAAKE